MLIMNGIVSAMTILQDVLKQFDVSNDPKLETKVLTEAKQSNK